MADTQYPFHFQSADGQFGLFLPDSAIEELMKFCRDAGNVETGGILIGRYSEDQATAVVDRVTGPPPDSKQFFARFLRGVQDLQELLNRLWLMREPWFYLGEWHYHPLPDASPSGDDIAQMSEIASSDQYACPEPILLIAAGPTTAGWLFSATVHPRRCIMQTMSRKRDGNVQS